MQGENLLIMEFKIDERGSWISDSLEGHCFDPSLCRAIGSVLKHEGANTIVDLGCGPGWYVRGLCDLGFDACGYDGNPYTASISADIVENGRCKTLELTVPFDLQVRYDYVLSLEVGEHIPIQFEDLFIGNLLRHSKKGLIISWGIVGQNGTGHVNCRDNDYIIDKMTSKGAVLNYTASNYLRNKASLSWFCNSIMVFNLPSKD